MKKNLLIMIIFSVFISFLLQGDTDITYESTVEEAEVLSSAGRIAEQWKKMMTDGLILVNFSEDVGVWYAQRLMLAEFLSCGVNKKDDPDCPYCKTFLKTDDLNYSHCLSIILRVYRDTNAGSPSANGYFKGLNQKGGFKTARDALANIYEDDFVYVKRKFVIQIIYALRGDVWVLENRKYHLDHENNNFDYIIKSGLKYKENGHIAELLISVPVQEN